MISLNWVQNFDHNVYSGEKDHQITVNQVFLERFEAEGNAFLDQIVTSDATWCHYTTNWKRNDSL